MFRGFKFSRDVSLGDVVTTTVLILAALFAWGDMRFRVDANEKAITAQGIRIDGHDQQFKQVDQRLTADEREITRDTTMLEKGR